MQATSTVTTKGQVLIPAPLRKLLDIRPFDRVTFTIAGSRLTIQKSASIDEMFGYIKTKKKFTDAQLEKAIAAATEQGIVEDA